VLTVCESNPFKKIPFDYLMGWVQRGEKGEKNHGLQAWDTQLYPPLNYKVQFLPVFSQPLAKLARLSPALGPGHSAMIQNFL